VNLVGVTGTTYSKLIELPKPNVAGACDYVVSLEARYVPDMGSTAPTLGFVVGDVRGWNSTGSAIEIKGIGTEWKKYGEPYQGLPDTAAISVQAHLQCGSEKVSGRIEVRGFQVQAITAPVYPAYPALTAMASLSGDGKTLHLIVFNKTADQDIPAGLHVEGFHPASASVTEVNGPGFNATDGVTETVQGAPLDVAAADPVHIFPAHSMTAIDFVAGSHP
jgi:alpha-N-arabinofuranosidase